MFRKCKDLVKAILPTSAYRLLREGIFRCMGYIKFAVKLILFPFVWLYMWILNIKQPTKVTTLISCRIGHLALNTDLFVRQRKNDTNERIIFLAPLPVSNEFLLQKWSELIEVVSVSKHPFYVRCLSLLLFFKSKYAFELPYEGNEYDVYHSTANKFYFTDSEKQEGDRILEGNGYRQK